MSARTHRDVGGVSVPRFLYGTAWKEDATQACVAAALDAGFRGIDTANQRKHYFEEGVGRALVAARKAGLGRDDVFVQTKFTFRDGQDHRLPYDPSAPIAAQVAQSVKSSLDHLDANRLDSLVLHGPSRRDGLGPDDHAAWREMEAQHARGRTRLLGVSNIGASQLADLLAFAKVPPSFVQNRCYADRGWDRAVRALCDRHGLVYQGFSLLTANRAVLAHARVVAMAAAAGLTPSQLVFAFALSIGMLPLTGTRDPQHLREDLAVLDVTLPADDVAAIESIAG